MEGMTLAEVAEAVDGRLVGAEDAGSVEPAGGSNSTTTLKPGELFFALAGERTDGHRFLKQAFEAGASAAVVSNDWFAGARDEEKQAGRLVVVAATDLAMGDLARAYRKRFDIPVVGITGSNGKTTTKDMTAAVLATRYNVLATEGNLNTRLGVPLTIFRLSPEHDVAVVEMGISEQQGLTYLCEIAQPTIGIITNVGPTHLEFLGSVEEVAQAKGELLGYLDESSMAILNFDDLQWPVERVKGRLLGFGIDEICQFRGEGLVLDREGCGCFSLQSRKFQLSVPGRHNVYNALAATAAGWALEVPLEDAAQALRSFKLTRLRSQLLEKDGIRLYNDAYNANPASMRAALTALSSMATEGRRIAVLGDMLELGPGAPAMHREIGQAAAESNVDRLVAVGSFAEDLAEGWRTTGDADAVETFAAREPAVERLKAMLEKGDLLLIKGSRGSALEQIAEGLGFDV